MYLDRSPVDELARVRARMAELRAREAALKAHFLENNDMGRFPGFAYDVIVERTEQEVFDITRLPADVLEDPANYRTRFVTDVRIVEKQGARLALAPSGSWDIEGDMHLIEPRRA